jgi:hypothetical protein
MLRLCVLHTVTHFSLALILLTSRSALNSTQFVMHISNRPTIAIQRKSIVRASNRNALAAGQQSQLWTTLVTS